jgi:hypothetical protein
MTAARSGPVPTWVVDGLVAGAVAGVVSGLPSTAAAVRQGTGVLTATRAAGTLLGRPTVVRGAVAHVALSLGWGVGLARVLPRRTAAVGMVAGAVAGAAIAALDLVVIGRRIPAIRRLPPVPQWLDHLAFGAVVGVVVVQRSRQGGRASAV